MLALRDEPIDVDDLRATLPRGQELDIAFGEPPLWSQIVLKHIEGPDIALVERDPVLPGELGSDEIQEYLQEIQGEKPDSAIKWLTEFLPKVKVIYALQILYGSEVNDGWAGIHAVQAKIWQTLGGILQADAEGFTTEHGHQITWQFDADHKTNWTMSVLDGRGMWQAFEMRLDDPMQKRAFLEGRIPPDAKLL